MSAGGAAAAVLLGLLGCTGPSGGAELQSTVKPQAEKEEVHAPASMEVDHEVREVVAADEHGADVVFELELDVPQLKDVPDDIGDKFDAAVERVFSAQVEQLTEVTAGHPAEALSCGVADGCRIPVTISASVAEIYEGFGTAGFVTSLQYGTTSGSVTADAVTVDLKTGTAPDLGDFVDLEDSAVAQRIATLAAVSALANQACASEAPKLERVAAWNPTTEGLVLVWDQHAVSNACGRVTVTAPWAELELTENVASSVGIPDCEAILPIDQANAVMGVTNIQFVQQSDDAAFLAANTRIGPAARAAFQEARQIRSCTWAIPNSDGFINFNVAELPKAASERFLGELRASDFEEAGSPGLPVFAYDDGARGIIIGRIQFGFAGNVVVHTEDTNEQSLHRALAGLALFGYR